MRDDTAFKITAADEKETLVAFLRFHQDTLSAKVEGVAEGDLRKALVPSGVTLAGLLKHVTYVHARWFEMCFRNETPNDLPWPTDDWVASDDETIDVLAANYRRHVDLSRRIVEEASLDDLNKSWDGGGWEPGTYNLRWVMTHMIEELARHNGHADIIREQLDGTTGV